MSSTAVGKKSDAFGSASNGKLGMWIYLVTDAMTFAGFLIAYALLRVRNPQWPNPADYLGITLSAIATFVLICSSVTMVLAQSEGEQKRTKNMAKYLAVTMFGGIIFLGIQAYEYAHLMHSAHTGMSLSDFLHGPPQFSSTFFVVTGFHGLHVLTGVIYLAIILGRTLAGKYDSGNVNTVEICGLFWHFVDLVWILVFTFIYLI